MQGQMTLDMFLDNPQETAIADEPIKPAPAIDYSCFSSRRGNHGENSIKLGECPLPKGESHKCSECEAHITFYEKANEFHEAGNGWGLAVAMAYEYFGIEVVPEYSVAAYRKKEGLT